MPTANGLNSNANISQNSQGTGDVSNADPSNLDAWLNQDAGSDQGLGYNDEYIAPDEWQDSDLTLSVADSLASMQNAVTEIKSQLQNKKLDTNERKQLVELLNKANNSLSKLKHLQNRHVEQLPLELAQSVNDVQLALNSTNEVDGSAPNDSSQEDSDTLERDQLKKQIADLEAQIKDNPELKSKLDRASIMCDLKGNDISQAQEIYADVLQQFQTLQSVPKAAADFAKKFNKDPNEVVSAAQEAGVDLDHLPQPPDAKVIKMLSSLNIPDQQKIADYNQLKQKRETNIKELFSKTQAEIQADDDSNESLELLMQTDSYRAKTDSEYSQMQAKEKEMQAQLVDGLNALGYTANASTSADTMSSLPQEVIVARKTMEDFMHHMGHSDFKLPVIEAAANQITVNGKVLDFFNEDFGECTLSDTHSQLTQNDSEFYRSPNSAVENATSSVASGNMGSDLFTKS